MQVCVGFPACGSIKNKKTIRTLILAKNPKDQNESNSGSNSKRYEWWTRHEPLQVDRE